MTSTLWLVEIYNAEHLIACQDIQHCPVGDWTGVLGTARIGGPCYMLRSEIAQMIEQSPSNLVPSGILTWVRAGLL